MPHLSFLSKIVDKLYFPLYNAVKMNVLLFMIRLYLCNLEKRFFGGNQMIKKIITVACLFIISAGLIFAGGAQENGMGTIVVGTSAGFRPFEYKEFGDLAGFDIGLGCY